MFSIAFNIKTDTEVIQEMDSERNKITYTKNMLVRKISEKCRISVKNVSDVYDTLESLIFDILSSADLNTETSIRLFEGISLESTFTPEKTKVNNLTGETIVTSSKIKPKANITRNYREKLTNHNG